MRREGFDMTDAVAVLERTPAALTALLSGLPERWTRSDEGAGSWSPHEVVVHLIHGERANWIPRARHILAGETQPFDPFDRTAGFAEGRATPLEALLADFAEARRESLSALAALGIDAEALARTGTHPELGTVTLGQLLATWVTHDLTHLAQVARTMARGHTEAVGPWRGYLSILRDRAPVGG